MKVSLPTWMPSVLSSMCQRSPTVARVRSNGLLATSAKAVRGLASGFGGDAQDGLVRRSLLELEGGFVKVVSRSSPLASLA